MLIAVDIGNTNIVIGFMDPLPSDQVDSAHPLSRRHVADTYRMTTTQTSTSDEYGIALLQFLALSSYKPSDVEGVIIASVVPQVMHSFRSAIIKVVGTTPMIVSPGVKTGINVKLDDPKSLGSDCLCDCVAAYYLYNSPSLVVDMGTATTYNIVDSGGTIATGLISAGLQTSARALAGGTAQLPQVEIRRPGTITATNTIDAIQSGLYYSFLGGLQMIINQSRKEFSPDLTVIATGGLGRVVEADAKDLDLIDVYDPDLIFKGMDIIYNRTTSSKNRGHKKASHASR